MDVGWVPKDNVNMAPVKKPKPILQPHFMAQWREFRGMKQEEAADPIGISRSLLSKIENSESPWSQSILQQAAKVYRCSMRGLLEINPLDDRQAADLDSIMSQATPELRAEIVGYAQGRLDGDQR